MAKKSKPEESASRTAPRDRHAFDHLSKEERFLLFVAPAMGAARAARCITLDAGKACAAWAEISRQPVPINLEGGAG